MWYELLCGDWPFKGQPPEAIIWQVGKGMKQTLANLQASRDVKVTPGTKWTTLVVKVDIVGYKLVFLILGHSDVVLVVPVRESAGLCKIVCDA